MERLSKGHSYAHIHTHLRIHTPLQNLILLSWVLVLLESASCQPISLSSHYLCWIQCSKFGCHSIIPYLHWSLYSANSIHIKWSAFLYTTVLIHTHSSSKPEQSSFLHTTSDSSQVQFFFSAQSLPFTLTLHIQGRIFTSFLSSVPNSAAFKVCASHCHAELQF